MARDAPPTMRLVATRLGAASKHDRLQYLRADGSACENTMPRQGILPHDLIHYVVESRMRLANGFLGLVARGADAGFAMTIAHDPGNRDIERQAIQAEALVEALQAQLWSGAFDDDAFRYGLATACEARGVAAPDLPDEPLDVLLFAPAIDLAAEWARIAPHATLDLTFAPVAD